MGANFFVGQMEKLAPTGRSCAAPPSYTKPYS